MEATGLSGEGPWTSVQTVRSRQEEDEDEGSEGAVECSELGSVACQTLP